MVNPEIETNLTDFVESTFVGENSKFVGYCAGITINSRRVYPFAINYASALRNSLATTTASTASANEALGLPPNCHKFSRFVPALKATNFEIGYLQGEGHDAGRNG
jgi:hypothetical protein